LTTLSHARACNKMEDTAYSFWTVKRPVGPVRVKVTVGLEQIASEQIVFKQIVFHPAL